MTDPAAAGAGGGGSSGAPADAKPPGLVEASRRLAAALVAAGRTRIELAAVELEEARLQLVRLWIRAALTLGLLFTGSLMAVGWWLLVSDPDDRVWIAGGLAVAFLLAGGAMAWAWRREARSVRPWLSSSLAELALDEAALRGAPARPHRPDSPDSPDTPDRQAESPGLVARTDRQA